MGKSTIENTIKQKIHMNDGFHAQCIGKGKKIKAFNVIDDNSQESLYRELDYSIYAKEAVFLFYHLIKRLG